ncbi:hypothetical protein PG985_009993 [Apiospora marii]|uniref:Uncharacterized protein n=1 Tax=Apiospora marii TaxID=335849 RepID=A0ABR1RKL0_9PEZI
MHDGDKLVSCGQILQDGNRREPNRPAPDAVQHFGWGAGDGDSGQQTNDDAGNKKHSVIQGAPRSRDSPSHELLSARSRQLAESAFEPGRRCCFERVEHGFEPVTLYDYAVDIVAADGVDGLLDAVALADGQAPPGLPVPMFVEGVRLVVLEVPVRHGAAPLQLVVQVLAPLADNVGVVVGAVDLVVVPYVEHGLHVDTAGFGLS